MKTAKKILFYTTIIVGTLLILATLLSLIYNVHYWFLKELDFPRVQVALGLLACLVLFCLVNRQWKLPSVLLALGLVVSLMLQATFILPYTPLVGKQVENISSTAVPKGSSFSLLIANVWMKNREAQAFLDIVQQANPDMVLAMETNQWWEEQLAPLREQYPYHVLYPLNNTYGMLLFSRLPLQHTDIKFLKHQTVPSIHTTVQLPDGQTFVLHAMHPVPPKPSPYPDNVGGQEVELVKVGEMVAQSQQPTVVAGDFNDVAWSRTSRLFGTQSKLQDVRVGRWLYNSFDAKSFLLRWPLDQVYASNEFRVVDLKRLPKFGSDHFPIYVQLALPK